MTGNDYNFTLSGAGKILAGERFQISQYAGAAPVSLGDYHEATKAQTARVQIDRKALRSAFSDLIVSDRLLDQLGPALISQNSIFIYGPTGNGKTSLAERMLRRVQALHISNAVQFVVHVALSRLPSYRDTPGDDAWNGMQAMTRDLAQLGRAFARATAGEAPDDLPIYAFTTSAIDPELAPAGRHTLYLACPAYPARFAGGESGPGARPCDVAWIRGVMREVRAGRGPEGQEGVDVARQRA